MFVKGSFDAPGLTKNKRYKVIRAEGLDKIWFRRFLINDDNKELTWCYDDEVEEVR
jgi:hypothetical protein